MVSALLNLLPSLALVGLALTGMGSLPSVLAHQPVARTPRDHHRHLATRQKITEGIGAKEQRRKPAAGLVRRNSDGSMCRVRGSSLAPSSVTTTVTPTSTVVAASESMTAAPTTTSTPAAAVSSSSDGAAYVEALAASSSTTTEAAATYNAAAYAAPSAATASATTSSASVAAAVSTSSGGGNGKLGAAWPNGDWASPSDPDYIGNYIGSKTNWYYTWSPFNVGAGDAKGLEFVPMLWGPNQVSDFWAQQSKWPSTVSNALFFNEPNEASQCNMAASDSVSYWMSEMVPLKTKGISLGGAATTSAPSGVQWILDFARACTQKGNSAADCTMAFVPIHWYDVSVDGFQQYIENFHKQTGVDIWITEYACQNFNGGAQCSDSDVWSLHQSMAPWMDEQDYIKRYSPFGIMKSMQGVNQDNALMDTNGDITQLGSWYINTS